MKFIVLTIDIYGERRHTKPFNEKDMDKAVSFVIDKAREFSSEYDACETIDDVDEIGMEVADGFEARIVDMELETENPVLKEKEKEKEPLSCVGCGSDEIDAGHLSSDHGVAWRDVTCKDCEVIWVERFEFREWEIKD